MEMFKNSKISKTHFLFGIMYTFHNSYFYNFIILIFLYFYIFYNYIYLFLYFYIFIYIYIFIELFIYCFIYLFMYCFIYLFIYHVLIITRVNKLGRRDSRSARNWDLIICRPLLPAGRRRGELGRQRINAQGVVRPTFKRRAQRAVCSQVNSTFCAGASAPPRRSPGA